ncbi:esterase-like activity of phytase family protein [Larkinella soli]|uniref:esterase-like activity of phytase family protein n=1 Tax=Larkinella soli TaxID=1770527 RepID=UPI0019CFB2C5|nr:esterase-like activity of phytase family protein [Larkinella soli]
MKLRFLHVLLAGGMGSLLYACMADHRPIPDPLNYPAFAEVPVLGKLNGGVTSLQSAVEVNNGGFGSAIAVDPKHADVFFLLTDRGPNVDGSVTNSKIFAKADFSPQIGRFRLVDGKFQLEQLIELRDETGKKLTGLPNPAGQGGTGELAFDLQNNTLPLDPNGLDSEGLAVAPDGSFWVSDEYGPHIVHFDKDGKTLERINPFGSGVGGRRLPKVFATRRANRGMEGLTITPDGTTLVGIMQSPMENPSRVSGSLVLRILTFNIATGVTRQFVYLMESTSVQGVSEILAESSTSFLVLERDDAFPESGKNRIKKIYRIDLNGATDVSDPADGMNGKLYGPSGQTVEQLKDLAGLTAAGIVPVKKDLAFDIVAGIPTYPHDKPEGITLVGQTLAIANDDDFGVASVNGAFAQKILPATGQTDKNFVYFVKLK